MHTYVYHIVLGHFDLISCNKSYTPSRNAVLGILVQLPKSLQWLQHHSEGREHTPGTAPTFFLTKGHQGVGCTKKEHGDFWRKSPLNVDYVDFLAPKPL